MEKEVVQGGPRTSGLQMYVELMIRSEEASSELRNVQNRRGTDCELPWVKTSEVNRLIVSRELPECWCWGDEYGCEWVTGVPST